MPCPVAYVHPLENLFGGHHGNGDANGAVGLLKHPLTCNADENLLARLEISDVGRADSVVAVLEHAGHVSGVERFFVGFACLRAGRDAGCERFASGFDAKARDDGIAR